MTTFASHERSGGLGAGLEQMRVDVGVGENACHRDVAAADLIGDVAVEILRGDDFDGSANAGRQNAANDRIAT